MKNSFIIVETTYPNISLAKKLAKLLLKNNLAACIEFFPIKSCYIWQNKINSSNEILLKIKTKNSLYKKIEKTINEHHPYKTPQIIANPILKGFDPYLEWIDSNTSNK